MENEAKLDGVLTAKWSAMIYSPSPELEKEVMHGSDARLETYLLTNDVVSRFNVSRNLRRPRPVGVIHHPHIRPHAVLVNSVLGKLDKLQLVDLHVRNISFVRRHPRRNGTLVAVEPVRPVKGDVAAGANLGNVAGRGGMTGVARHGRTAAVRDGADITAAKGDSIGSRPDTGVETDIPSWVAAECC